MDEAEVAPAERMAKVEAREEKLLRKQKQRRLEAGRLQRPLRLKGKRVQPGEEMQPLELRRLAFKNDLNYQTRGPVIREILGRLDGDGERVRSLGMRTGVADGATVTGGEEETGERTSRTHRHGVDGHTTDCGERRW